MDQILPPNHVSNNETSQMYQNNMMNMTVPIDCTAPQVTATLQPSTQSKMSIQRQILQMNNEHGFFYTRDNGNFYYVTCKIIPHSLIVNILNEVDLNINNFKKEEPSSLSQKFHLEQDLKRILEMRSNFDGNMNTFNGYDNDGQNSFNNCFPHHYGIGGYAHNVIHPQQQGDFNGTPQHIPDYYTNSFHGNFGNNMTNSQNNFNNGYFHQNGDEDYNVTPQQQGDFNEFIETRPDYNENEFGNNVAVTRAVSTNIDQNYQNCNYCNYCNDNDNVQDINVVDFNYPQFTQPYIPVEEMSPDYIDVNQECDACLSRNDHISVNEIECCRVYPYHTHHPEY